MAEQLKLFPERHCDLCLCAIGPSEKNDNLFDGFVDASTGMFVCRTCKPYYNREWWRHFAVANPGAELPVPPSRLWQEMPASIHQFINKK